MISGASFALSAAGALACVVVWLLSCVPVPPVPVIIWAPLVLGVGPLVLGLILSGHARSGWPENRWLSRALAVAFALALISFVSGVVQLGHGVPEIIHGAYYQDSHGTLTRVSRSTYLWAARAGARMASGVGCAFYAGAASTYADLWRDD